MKTALGVLITGLLVLGGYTATASPTRTDTAEYTIASGAAVGHGELGNSEVHWTLGADYAVFEAARGERAVSLEIVDSSGMTARGHVHIDLDGDGKLDRQVDFCGSTTKPISVRGGSVIEVGTIFGVCEDGSPSIVTEGEITATFTK